jgi:hypothetical protein
MLKIGEHVAYSDETGHERTGYVSDTWRTSRGDYATVRLDRSGLERAVSVGRIRVK